MQINTLYAKQYRYRSPTRSDQHQSQSNACVEAQDQHGNQHNKTARSAQISAQRPSLEPSTATLN
jgi:hypothetical protein